jgi:hypothetical protein
MSNHDPYDERNSMYTAGRHATARASLFFRPFLFPATLSFLDNNIHLIRSRDHTQTDIGSSRTRSLLLLAAPVLSHRGRPPLFHLSLIFSAFFSFGLSEQLASEHWLFWFYDFDLMIFSAAHFSTLILCFSFRFIISLFGAGYRKRKGFWAKPCYEVGGLGLATAKQAVMGS